MISINARMQITASIVLACFLGITGITLEEFFRSSAEAALKERLQVHLNTLIAATEPAADGSIALHYRLPEPRFFMSGSGLYAKVVGNNGRVIWSSISMEGITIPFQGGLGRGEDRYQYLDASDGSRVLSYSLGLTWGDDDQFREGSTYFVAESLERLEAEMFQFRRNLWGWLAGLTFVLLIMLEIILRWGLSPLRRVANDLRDIEAGRHVELLGNYPRELRGLTGNLNALIRNNREHEARYQASLGDLAHSLKTPLAVLRGAIEVPNQSVDGLRSTIEEQVARMDQIAQYQLQRAATSGRTALLAPVNLQVIINKVVKALDKVYADKGVDCRVVVEPDMKFHGNEGDLMELLGNLVDNAYKWCKQRVDVHLRRDDARHGPCLLIEVMDDGRGIDEAEVATVLARGGRLDEETSGHGLGLAMVGSIVDLYKGMLEITRARLGGASIRLWLPWN